MGRFGIVAIGAVVLMSVLLLAFALERRSPGEAAVVSRVTLFVLVAPALVLLALLLVVVVSPGRVAGTSNVHVYTTDRSVVVDLRGMARLLALKNRLELPLDAVRSVQADPEARKLPKGIRMPGTHIPGVLTAGTYRMKDVKSFWYVGNGRNAVVIELEGAGYDRIVVEVENPAETVTAIERRLRA